MRSTWLGGDDARGRGEVERDAEVLGEVVERAEGKDAERHVAAGEGAGDGADGAVAAGGDDGVDASGRRPRGRLRRVVRRGRGGCRHRRRPREAARLNRASVLVDVPRRQRRR